ncbi:MAG: ATP-binding protein [Bacteroidales bacterium]|nr:ATP-binding protein [Bacteroidales bacterium]MDD3893335.1 ATP-binding protein [Bacteroidales bacterium]
MQNLIVRKAENFLKVNLDIFPAVTILGPRQCGKSTLVKMLSNDLPNLLYLDLQNRNDLAKLSEPDLFFQANRNKTICLDEIQLIPNLFSVLRSEIDSNRQNGRFILLGSASRDLIQKSSESLAGRVGLIELTPFLASELIQANQFNLNTYWLRGAFPDSYLAKTDSASVLWRENFLRTYVERDIPQLGFQIPAQQLKRMLIMSAHSHAQIFNASKLGESLGLTHPTVKRYLDLLEQTFILRSLLPYEFNTKKRLVKSPKVYVRDSGLLHRLLQIDTFNALLSHPIVGASWEGLVIENICSSLKDCQFSFYRSAAGNELDLIIQKDSRVFAVECKASTAPKLTQGFWKGIEDVKPQFTYVVAPVLEKFPIAEKVWVCNLSEVIDMLTNSL